MRPHLDFSTGPEETAMAVRAAAYFARAIYTWWRLLPRRHLPPTLGGPTYLCGLVSASVVVQMRFGPAFVGLRGRTAAAVCTRCAFVARVSARPGLMAGRPAGELWLRRAPHTAENLPSLLDPLTRDRPVSSMGRHVGTYDAHYWLHNMVVILSR